MSAADSMLLIEDLHLQVGKKTVLRDLNLEIKEGEIMVMFGPNGAGKSSLLMAIMGFPGYRVIKGRILFRGRDLQGMSIDRRARLGIGLMFQRPPTVRGVKVRRMLELAGGRENADRLAEELHLSDFLNRDINSGFSGGEIKRSEVMQLRAQAPALALFDEPESGVDLENLVLVGKSINKILGVGHRKKRKKSALIITHTGYILDVVDADTGCVLVNQRVHCVHNPREIFKQIQSIGFEECRLCQE